MHDAKSVRVIFNPFICFLFFLSGCSLTDSVHLTKRLSYQTEKQLELTSDNSDVYFIGHPDNLKLFIKGRNNGFIGSGRTQIYDVGLTFNNLVEQASKYLAKHCENVNCNYVTLHLKKADLQYHLGFEQLKKVEFKTTVEYQFPKLCNNHQAISVDFYDVLNVSENEYFSPDRGPFMIPIENVLVQVMVEGNALFKKFCKIS